MSEQNPLINAIAKVLDIPAKFIPTDVVLAAEGPTPSKYGILAGREPFSEKKWKYELGHLVSKLVTSKEKEHPLHPPEELYKVAENLLSHIKHGSRENIHHALLGQLMLAYNYPEAAKLENFHETINHSVLEKYPLDVFLQAAGNKLLEIEEDLEQLEITGPSFQYPPFQKALPYFPNYGYQVTLVFNDDQLDKEIKRNLENMLTLLKVKCEEIDHPYQLRSAKKQAHAGFNVGFELNFWCSWCSLMEREPSVPVKEARKMMNSDDSNFMKQHLKLRYTQGHVWIYLKAETKKDSEMMLQTIRDYVAQKLPEASLLVTTAYKKNEGRIFGGQFLDGISNAVDVISMIREVLIPPLPADDGQISPEGGTFAFIQFFKFDKTALSDVSQPVSENMIGRDSHCSEVLARPNDRCHVKRARVISPIDGSNTELIRQSLPYSASKEPQRSEDANRGPMSDGLFFVAFGQSAKRFSDVLNNILGRPKSAFTDDLLITNVQGRFGKLFYCPSTDELQVLPKFTEEDLYPPIPFWTKYSSKNEAFFYNHIQYLYAMSTGYKHGDPPSKRILYLMSKTFARWHSTWVHKFDVPRLPHLKEFLNDSEQHIMDEPIQVRKGYSYKVMLGQVFTSHKPHPREGGKVYAYSENFDTYRIEPKELIVGVTDRLSFGSGKEVMPYLKEGSERTLSFNLGLAEDGNMGHIVPGHSRLLEVGIAGILQELREKVEKQDYNTLDQKIFYQSAIHAFEGVQLYLLKYAGLARRTAKKMLNRTSEANDRKNLREIANRMIRLAYGKPSDFSFHDAVQMIFSMHCCLHLCGQPVSVGRLDQLLIAFYNRDRKKGILQTPEEAQEIIDAFFIKFDEHVVLNRYNIPYGHTSYGSTAVTGRGGPFPTGDSMNQWIQQITVGGCDEKGEDACNDITLMCLKACRRLPLNAPCVSLRLTKSTSPEVKHAAADAILSGGAHPILYHDEKMLAGLYNSLHQSFHHSNLPDPDDLMQVARNYSCDGCYEPMFTGQTEFKFAYIPLLKAVIFTLNCGADYLHADPLNLAGGVSSYKTLPPNDINTFEQFKDIFLIHLKVMVQGLYSTILNSYGNPWLICPSPMLSCLLEGCIDSGKDMTNGGSRFHILTPMFTGFANTVNSLYNVKTMVFNEGSVATMEMLRMALMNNWGENMVEPFYDMTGEGTIHTKMWAQRFKDLRDYALGLPKFGKDTSNKEISELAEWLANKMDSIAYECLYEEGPILEKYKELRKKHSTPGKPFLFQVMTGTGTFESYVSVGAGCAATPDGRLKGQPTASDCSQQPYPQDRPVPNDATPLDIVNSLKPYLRLDKHIPNGCEVDVNIPEDFPREALLEFIEAFINDETGPNLVTVTCANPETLERARVEPQKFDLVRNRMGGWSNFFVSMFNKHQLQHMRRPMYGKHENTV